MLPRATGPLEAPTSVTGAAPSADCPDVSPVSPQFENSKCASADGPRWRGGSLLWAAVGRTHGRVPHLRDLAVIHRGGPCGRISPRWAQRALFAAGAGRPRGVAVVR